MSYWKRSDWEPDTETVAMMIVAAAALVTLVLVVAAIVRHAI